MNSFTSGLLLGFLLGLSVAALVRRFNRYRLGVARHGLAASSGPGGADEDTPLLDAMLGGGAAPKSANPPRPSPGLADLGLFVAGLKGGGDVDAVEKLRQNLRVKFLHDEEKVRKAIDRERELSPNDSELEILKSAVYRWERENR